MMTYTKHYNMDDVNDQELYWTFSDGRTFNEREGAQHLHELRDKGERVERIDGNPNSYFWKDFIQMSKRLEEYITNDKI